MAKKTAKKRRRKPSQARSAATVEAIIEATAQVLIARGYEGATTNRVAERAGVSIGTLYQYFPNKDALMAELVERQVKGLVALVLEVLPKLVELDLREAVPLLIDAIIGHHNDPRRVQAIMMQLPRAGGFELLERFESVAEGASAEVLVNYQGTLKPADPELAGRMLFRAVAGIIRITVRRDPDRFNDPAFRRELAALVLGYLV